MVSMNTHDNLYAYINIEIHTSHHITFDELNSMEPTAPVQISLTSRTRNDSL